MRWRCKFDRACARLESSASRKSRAADARCAARRGRRRGRRCGARAAGPDAGRRGRLCGRRGRRAGGRGRRAAGGRGVSGVRAVRSAGRAVRQLPALWSARAPIGPAMRRKVVVSSYKLLSETSDEQDASALSAAPGGAAPPGASSGSGALVRGCRGSGGVRQRSSADGVSACVNLYPTLPLAPGTASWRRRHWAARCAAWRCRAAARTPRRPCWHSRPAWPRPARPAAPRWRAAPP
jgi:hypothetical protein